MWLSARVKDFPKDQWIVFFSFTLLAALAWAAMFVPSLLYPAKTCPLCHVRPVAYFEWKQYGVLFFMWTVMMVAMMIPSALPMILTFFTINQKRNRSDAFLTSWLFVFGYLLVWTLFSAVASFLQLYLHQKTILSTDMVSQNGFLSGALLLIAGVFQFTSLKKSCLYLCQSPFNFIMFHWKEGKWGAIVMGLQHGLFCLGCCWALMLLLFVLGVMNFWWVAFLTVVVLIEKIVPRRFKLSQFFGITLIVWGLSMIVLPFLK